MEDKIYFQPGMLVTTRYDLPNKPIMWVIGKQEKMFKSEDGNLKGIRCRWFTTTGELQENVFNTKDLILINNG